MQQPSVQLCLSGYLLSVPANEPPTVAFTANKQPAVSVARGTPYAACVGSDHSLPACEAGATAADAEDGDLTAAVLSCPPEDCLWKGCPGHEFAAKGAVPWRVYRCSFASCCARINNAAQVCKLNLRFAQVCKLSLSFGHEEFLGS
jgi:hypothetical protein